MQSYRDLIAWQKGMDFAERVYDVTRSWPRDETYGLAQQVRREAVSIPSNIAEGKGRSGPNEFLHHLSIAHGSLCEVETQLLLGHRLGYIDDASMPALVEQGAEVGRLIHGLIRRFREG